MATFTERVIEERRVFSPDSVDWKKKRDKERGRVSKRESEVKGEESEVKGEGE